ncbi:MAG: transglycosylase SLT domain-containing protein [Lamprobacter sp.]|uniref:transglycosylase SLT domain-containing protein n=1 Tax=Lamprobacter sp. TaxID=3100796 RepID=UPI002B25894D|nr:transglycosylase SLT domain-containing protein [Lamprobacter sp.]MEA3640121.1 transglycosylase SLT domain-containing protein [Lamprobacter sp.]
MQSAARTSLLACVAIGLPLQLIGCASHQPPEDTIASSGQTFSVSAREYGYVRPAIDVRVIGRDDGKTRSRHRYVDRGAGGDLWDRVRHGERLGIHHHERVERAVRTLKQNSHYLTDLSKRAQPYLHLIIEELERHGLPAELALLPEVESRYNPHAVSPKSATGMWQFMPYTGVEMGLRQNSWYDGRNDILASTRGAIAYLQQLHRELGGDWALALAGYNAGPARVRAAQRANKAAGKPVDFWSLDLPTETENYVPKLLAIAKLVREHDALGLSMPAIANRPLVEVVESGQQIDLAEAAHACGVTLTQLKRLNPGLKRGKTLPNGPHLVLVPAGTGDRLRSALAQGGTLKAPNLAATNEPSAAQRAGGS